MSGHRVRTGALVLALLAVTGCGATRDPARGPSADVAQVMAVPSLQQADRTITRTAGIRVGVRELAPARARAVALVEDAGGMVERESSMERILELRVRIPEAQLDAVLDSLGRLGEVRHREVASEDRTAQAADLDARVRNLTATRDRLRALQDRATSVADIVAVERELSRVQGELDALAAQLAVLRGRAAMSTVDLALERDLVLGPLGLAAKGMGWVVAKLFVWR